MATLRNNYPPQRETHKRKGGGNKPAPASDEQHDQQKAKEIPEHRRWDKDAQRVEEKSDGE